MAGNEIREFRFRTSVPVPTLRTNRGPLRRQVNWVFGCALLAAFAPSAALAQAEKQPAFEVASVKRYLSRPAADPMRPLGGWPDDPAVVRYIGVHLNGSVFMRAYNVKGYQIEAPAWFNTEYYDIIAKAPEGTPNELIPAMLRNLLEERFKMTVRRETRELSVYALVVGKDGPNLKPTDKPAAGVHMLPTGELRASTFLALTNMLSTTMGRPVLDMTGLEGTYDIVLETSQGDFPRMVRPPTVPPGDGLLPESPSGVSIFSSIQKLGLKLESRKAPIEMIVVEKAEKEPIEN